MATQRSRPGPPPGRLLGLDVGERRIGVAISDPEQRLAVSLPTIDRKASGGMQELAAVVVRDEVVAVIVGLPLGLNGKRGPQAEKSAGFARDLEVALGLPVFLQDERLSTREALVSARPQGGRGQRSRGRLARIDTDAAAATIILQAFLDSLRGGAS